MLDKETNKFILPMVNVVKNLFTKMLNLKIQEGIPYPLESNAGLEFDILSIIGVSGEIKGSIALGFKKDVAAKIASMYWKKDIKELNEDVFDTIGELVNIVAGNAKKSIEEYKVYISLPNIVEGGAIKMIPYLDNKNIQLIVIPYNCKELGSFHIIFGYKVLV